MITERKTYMLDTNIVSHLIRRDALGNQLRQRLISDQGGNLSISTITAAELLYGLEKKPSATLLRTFVHQFLLQVDILPWTAAAAQAYAELRARSESEGITVAALDMLIASHARALNKTLITRDGGLLRLQPWLPVERWTD